MRRSFAIAVLLGAIPCFAAWACSSPSSGGFGPLPDPGQFSTPAPMDTVDAGDAGDEDATPILTCADYAAMADASIEPGDATVDADDGGVTDDGGASDAGDDGAVTVTPSPCQPNGSYLLKYLNAGDCPGFTPGSGVQQETFANAGVIWPAAGCDVPIVPFSDTVCQTYIPAGTTCATPNVLVTDCAYFWCNADASQCTWHIAVKFNPGQPSECSEQQTVTMTRM